MISFKDAWSATKQTFAFLKRIASLETRLTELETFLKGELPKDACPKCRKREFAVVASCPLQRSTGVISGIQRDFECSDCKYAETITEFFKTP